MGFPPVRIPALPQFVPLSTLPPLQGFDAEGIPRWQIVAASSFRTVFLDNAGLPGPTLTVTSLHPNIASITEIFSIPPIPRREFRINGLVSGRSELQVFAPNGRTVIGQLQVMVKNQSVLKVAFHRVTDGLFDTTTRPQATGANLQTDLNLIFGPQANVGIDSPPMTAAPVSLRTTLPELVMEQRERHMPKRGWAEFEKAGDPGSHLNVFFMPWQGTPGRLPSQIIQDATETILIFEDGMPVDNVLIALAHRIGRFLGAAVTTSDRHRHHVMHELRVRRRQPGPARHSLHSA